MLAHAPTPVRDFLHFKQRRFQWPFDLSLFCLYLYYFVWPLWHLVSIIFFWMSMSIQIYLGIKIKKETLRNIDTSIFNCGCYLFWWKIYLVHLSNFLATSLWTLLCTCVVKLYSQSFALLLLYILLSTLVNRRVTRLYTV